MWLVNSTMLATIVKQVALEDVSKNLTVLNAHLLFRDSFIITVIARKRHSAGVLPTTW